DASPSCPVRSNINGRSLDRQVSRNIGAACERSRRRISAMARGLRNTALSANARHRDRIAKILKDISGKKWWARLGLNQ
ncbi:MAG: hypothetical protein VX612_03190, partial [Pseudomonadota bacterium]|nr:hypothetical protein [Pseudomonadota bacterium]